MVLAPPARAFECQRLSEVTDRHDAGGAFVKTWTSFTSMAEGELVALRGGCIAYLGASAPPGREWFCLVHQAERRL